jgi:hypothetical protein
VGIGCADHVTPLYPQKLALTSPNGGGRSVGIVRSRTKDTEFFFYVLDKNIGMTNVKFIARLIRLLYNIYLNIVPHPFRDLAINLFP